MITKKWVGHITVSCRVHNWCNRTLMNTWLSLWRREMVVWMIGSWNYKQRLTTWLKDQNIRPGETIDSITISRLAEGPSRQVTSWNAYDINGYTYYTHTKDSKYVNQNNDVQIEALDGLGWKIQYFGIIEEIWELNYGMKSMPLDQTTPTEWNRIESPGPRESRLPRWPLGACFTCRISFLYVWPT